MDGEISIIDLQEQLRSALKGKSRNELVEIVIKLQTQLLETVWELDEATDRIDRMRETRIIRRSVGGVTL